MHRDMRSRQGTKRAHIVRQVVLATHPVVWPFGYNAAQRLHDREDGYTAPAETRSGDEMTALSAKFSST
jgi:hypothetical protein